MMMNDSIISMVAYIPYYILYTVATSKSKFVRKLGFDVTKI